MAVLRSNQGDTVELMVFGHYGSQDQGLVEAVLDDLANLGLADLGSVLPIGTLVTMPKFAPGAPKLFQTEITLAS